MTTNIEEMEHPKVTVELPADGKVTGQVIITFQDAGKAFVTTHDGRERHTLTYKGRPYLVGIHYVRNEDGTWAPRQGGYVHISRDDAKSFRDAPTTHQCQAILAAIKEVIGSHWSPLVDRQAETARITATLARLDHRETELQNELDAIHREQDGLLAQLQREA